jgi:hypothetical protein
MRARLLAAISAVAVVCLTANASAQVTCSNADITGRWIWEVTAYLGGTVYTFVCPVLIRQDRKLDPAVCRQVDNVSTTETGSFTAAAPFAVSSNCIVRNRGSMTLLYDNPVGGGSTWTLDTFDGWISRNKGTLTAVVAGFERASVKITAFRR